MAETTTVIRVQHRLLGGRHHVFTSEDVFGLYVASQDLREAFDAVAPSIVELLRLNESIAVTVEPVTSFRESLTMLRAPQTDADLAFVVVIDDGVSL